MRSGSALDENGVIDYDDESKTTFKYDNKGNKIEENWFSLDGKIEKSFNFKYNSKSDIIEINEFNSYGKLLKNLIYKYEYDKLGNWIKKTTFLNKIPKYVTERQIVYY